uniref:RZZ complex subunit KNTC1/ROD C-terminal domain-containing protein n=1 Tax=Parascaris univalens TaxID=6257 RepID=A0A915BMD4_PARUN
RGVGRLRRIAQRMKDRARFTRVEVDYGVDETRNFGDRVEYSSPTSLYEVMTLATVMDDVEEGEEMVTVETPTIKGASNGADLAVLIDQDLSLFDFAFTFKFIVTLHLANDAEALALDFLEQSRVLAILTRDAYLIFISVKLEKIVHRMKIREKAFTKGASMSCARIGEKGVICVCSEDGSCTVATISDYEQMLIVLENDATSSSSAMVESKTHLKSTLCDAGYSQTEVICSLAAQLMFPREKGRDTQMAMLGTREEKYSFFEHGDARDRGECIRALTCAGDRYLLEVSRKGWLTVWDMGTMIQLKHKRIVSVAEEVKSLTVLDEQQSIDSITIVLVVDNKMNGHTEVQVRSLRNAEVAYALAVGSETILLSFPPHEEFSILIVEPYGFNGELGEASVRIRVITESQPDARLDRLLNRMKFDDAEVFAKQFKLDIQKVHKSRVNSILSELSSDEAVLRDKFGSFLGHLDLITDHNWVTEMCIAGVTLCHSFEFISELLRYVDKRDISDEETLERLARLRYNLASYRLLYGPKASFGVESPWTKFIDDSLWKEIFLEFCKDGCFSEALIVWQRYLKEMREWMREEVDTLQQIVDLIQQVVSVDMNKLWAALELLELEVLPMAFGKDPLSTISMCTTWLKSLAAVLELQQPAEFPSNALKALSIVQRVMRSLVDESVTPAETAEVAHILMRTRVDSEDVSDFMGELNIYVKNLREMEKLRSVYECPMTYAKYTVETVESICYLILERVRSVHLIKGNIERYAKPYMIEHHLDFNRTLYNYIIKVSSKCSASVGDSNPWDERCLAVAEMISCRGLRCEALIGIARRAHPPWSASLKKAIQIMLEDRSLDNTMQSRLRYECDFAAFAQVMMRYAVPMATVKICVQSKQMFIAAIDFIFREVEVKTDPLERLQDALTIVDLSQKIKAGIINRIDCISHFAIFSIKHAKEDDGFNLLIKCLTHLDETERAIVIKSIIGHVVVAVNSPVTNRNNDLRLRKIGAAICILERFAEKNDDNVQLLMKLRAVRDLQVKYSLTVRLSLFDDDELKVALLKKFVYDRWDANASCMWLKTRSLCKKLFISVEVAFDVLLECAVAHDDALSSLQFAQRALADIDQPSKHFLDSLMHSCCAALVMMAHMAEEKDVEPLIFIHDTMRRVISSVVFIAPPDYAELQLALNIAVFVGMFEDLITQCLTDESPPISSVNGELPSHGRKELSGAAVRNVARGTDAVWGMDSLTGVYNFKSDGQVYDRIGAVRSIARLASSVNSLEMDSDTANCEMQRRWREYFSFLSVNNQTLMELCARSFYARLPCADEDNRQCNNNFEQCVAALCERIIVSSPADLWLASTTLLHLPTNVLQETLERLRNWSLSRKSADAMVSFLRICQFTVLCRGLNDRNSLVILEQSYVRSIWTRHLATLGATLPYQITPIAVVYEFVNACVPVKVLVEFCTDFMLDSTETTLMYALHMLFKCSKREDAKQHHEMLQLSERAFGLLEVAENIFIRLYDCLMSMDPYDYEAINLIIKQMNKHALLDSEQHTLIMRRASVALQFLVNVVRRETPTDNELRWFHERKTFIEHRMSNEQSALSILAEGNTDGSPVEILANDIYERHDMLDVRLPSRARGCLPFHPFLFEDSSDVRNILLPIIYAELSVYNVELWLELVRQMPRLAISKSDLLAKAILLLVNSRTESGMSLESGEVDKVRSLIFSAGNRVGVAKALMAGIRQIPLCETRLQILAIGVDVAQMWLGPLGAQLAKPVQEEEKKNIGNFAAYLTNSHRRYRTELLLRNADLLKTEIMDLLKSPTELIIHIYSNAIDWNDPTDKKTKLKLLNELVTMHGLDHASIQDELVGRWLTSDACVGCSHESPASEAAVASLRTPRKGLVYGFPYLDASVSRIVYLLRNCQPKEAAVYLTNLVNKDDAMVPYETKIRCMCCLMRLLDPDQFQVILGYDATNACITLERLLYSRLINACRLDLPMPTFMEQNKAHLARSLLSSGVRQSMELLHLIACIVVDYEVVDRKLVSDLLSKLYGGRQREIVSRLLHICRLYPSLARIDDLAMVWRDIADWMH